MVINGIWVGVASKQNAIFSRNVSKKRTHAPNV